MRASKKHPQGFFREYYIEWNVDAIYLFLIHIDRDVRGNTLLLIFSNFFNGFVVILIRSKLAWCYLWIYQTFTQHNTLHMMRDLYGQGDIRIFNLQNYGIDWKSIRSETKNWKTFYLLTSSTLMPFSYSMVLCSLSFCLCYALLFFTEFRTSLC